MLPRFGPILTILLTTPALACASGSMSLSDDVGLADDTTGGTTRGLPSPDPTFGSAEEDGTATGGDTSPPAESTAGLDDASESETGDPESGTTTTSGDSDTTGGLESTTSSSSDTGGSEESGTTGSAAPSVDVSGWRVVQVNSAREYEFPQGTILEPGMTIVVGRDASQVVFEAWWEVTLGEDVLYFDAGDTFPAINGGETFTLRDADDIAVDGPTPTMTLDANFQRNDAAADSAMAASWDQSPNPNGDATPGTGSITPAAEAVIVLTELSDTTGGGAFPYEFVELRFVAAAQ